MSRVKSLARGKNNRERGYFWLFMDKRSATRIYYYKGEKGN